MIRVAIYGIGGLYNYGCEAIIRGTTRFVRDLYGVTECEITYYSRRPSEDKKITDDLGISLADISGKSSFLKKCVSKAVDIFQIPIAPFYGKEFAFIMENSDVIFSVGGDIYTIPAYMRENHRYRYVNYLVEFGKKALKKQKKIIIYGASIGPFGDYKKALRYYCNHLGKVDSILCREKLSVAYLNGLGIQENVQFLPDPAFLVEDPQKEMHPEKKYLGINLSGLSMYELYGSVNEVVIGEIADILTRLSRETNIPLMLIPHVVSPVEKNDNDAYFLSRVFEKLQEDIKQKSLLAQPKSFLDAKSVLKQCKVVAAARMHCAVNAVTVGVPALFLSYSSKSKGMADFVYGSQDYCISLKDLNTQLIPKVKMMLENITDLEHQVLCSYQNAKDLYKGYVEAYKEGKNE